MFSTLLESRARRTRRPIATATSVAIHLVIGASLIALTAQASQRPDEPVEERVRFVAPPVAPPPAPTPPPPADRPVLGVAELPAGSRVLDLPLELPTTIPEIDLSRGLTREEDFNGRGLRGGSGTGTGTGTGAGLPTGESFTVAQVERAVTALPGPGPRYPEALRAAGVQGHVLVQFIVDTVGRAEPASVRVLSATHERFAEAVRAALPAMRFLPAEIGGRRVRQLVQQPFDFSLAR